MEQHDIAKALTLPMSAEQYAALRAAISEHGLRDPITVYEDKVLDGWHRYKACGELNIQPQTVALNGDTDPVAFVVDRLVRRHPSTSQRAMMAARIANLPVGANQHVGNSTPSQVNAAKWLSVSRELVIAARRIYEKGTPEEIAAVETDERAVSDVAAVIGERERNDPPQDVKDAWRQWPVLKAYDLDVTLTRSAARALSRLDEEEQKFLTTYLRAVKHPTVTPATAVSCIRRFVNYSPQQRTAARDEVRTIDDLWILSAGAPPFHDIEQAYKEAATALEAAIDEERPRWLKVTKATLKETHAAVARVVRELRQYRSEENDRWSI